MWGFIPAAGAGSRVRQLKPWFHNLRLGDVQTAPDHFLGNSPETKWRSLAGSIPEDLRGKTALDIGSNAGFYSIEMKRRGADRVLEMDVDETYPGQVRTRLDADAVQLVLRFKAPGEAPETFAILVAHPDALAGKAAVDILLQRHGRAPMRLEATAYHHRAGIMATCEFLPRKRSQTATVILSEEQRRFKQRLFACFPTRRDVPRLFPIGIERFRPVPQNHFTSRSNPIESQEVMSMCAQGFHNLRQQCR